MLDLVLDPIIETEKVVDVPEEHEPVPYAAMKCCACGEELSEWTPGTKVAERMYSFDLTAHTQGWCRSVLVRYGNFAPIESTMQCLPQDVWPGDKLLCVVSV
jgi:hypothetical protein